MAEAKGPPVVKRYAPSGIGTTGTTGIIFTTNDMVLWGDRIRKEADIHGKVNPEGFSIRSALKVPSVPPPPTRWEPASGGLSPEEASSRHAQEARHCLAQQGSMPRDRGSFPETSANVYGFTLMKSAGAKRRATSSGGLSRSATSPASLRAGSTRFLQAEAAAEARRRQRQQRLAEAEASVERAMADSRSFLNKSKNGVFRPRAGTDATEFDETFMKKTGVPLYKMRPSDAPVLPGAPAWQP